MKIANQIAENPAALSSAATPPRSVRAALADAMAQLEAHRVPSAGLAAELLLMYVLDCDRAWLYAHPESPLTPRQRIRYARLVAQRAAGAPTQYLTGRQEFWGLPFEVTPEVLIPRPESEHLIEVALDRLAPQRPAIWEPLRVADVGTGSGCLAVALARELPQARLLATDISAAALEVARRNAARHGVGDRIEFARMNILDLCLSGPRNEMTCFDLIVSNPPYVAAREADTLPREVREHEPPEALFAGQDGLAFYPALISQAEALLDSGGLLVIELGHGQAPQVSRLLDSLQWRGVAIGRDLAGIERVLSAQRTGALRPTAR